MDLNHERVQHPVGQGFFHSSFIDVEGAARFNYVYDCGSSAGAASRDKEIDAYKSNLKRRGEAIDVLFVSHAHEDHINGLPQLLGKSRPSTLHARTVVMPHLDAIARLIALAPSLDSSRDTFVEQFTVRGSAAFTELLNVDRVVEVYPGDDRPELPERGPDPDERAPADDNHLSLEGTGSSPVSAAAHSTRSDHESFFLSRAGYQLWEFRTFADAKVLSERASFIKALEKGLTSAGALPAGERLETWIVDPVNIRTLLSKHRRVLADAYGPSDERNATSLCLFSGPAAGGTVTGADSWATRWTYCSDYDRPAWLGTGDADLHHNFDNFAQHFKNQLERVGTLAVPHHGSRENSDSRLFDSMRPNFAVIASSPRGGYGHPHFETVHRASDSGAQLVIVNECAATRFTESVWISF